MRRFLTVEDIQRAGATREIVVDEETLVTPQAAEAAEAAGIVIKTPGSPYFSTCIACIGQPFRSELVRTSRSSTKTTNCGHSIL